MTRLVVATGNPHKIEEVKAILAETIPGSLLGGIVPMSDFDAPEPIEDGVTFEENALIKARSACQISGLPAIADDSGIAVDVLGGAPGVFSARWAGGHGDDVRNRELLLEQLADVPQRHRGAAFVSAIALVWPDGRELTVLGRVQGTLTQQARGLAGFGYDPIFVPTGRDRTTAEMSPEEKNALSHRGIALRKLTEEIRQILAG